LLETERLFIRRFEANDAEFILELLNEPAFIRNIADRGVRSVADAAAYIQNGPVASYEKFGFGLFWIGLKDTGAPIGMCGLLKRDFLPDVDIGYALLERYWARGYALEAAGAVLEYGWKTVGLKRIVAITAPHNEASARLLGKLGMQFEGLIHMPGSDADTKLFGLNSPTTQSDRATPSTSSLSQD
jgi:RimJ/RimL family protein N-acetyltransferase